MDGSDFWNHAGLGFRVSGFCWHENKSVVPAVEGLGPDGLVSCEL